MIKILNLYAGIGGNRKLWGGDIEVTAVENIKEISKIYQDFFPKDKVIVGDAHQFLLNNYQEYDFIWSSPPCPTHTRFNNLKKEQIDKRFTPKFPDMQLYEEILFLFQYYKGKFVVENVKSFYEPLVKPFEIDNHYFWSNFPLTGIKKIDRGIRTQTIEEKEKSRGFKLEGHYPIKFKEKVLNNCVFPEVGKHIFRTAFKEPQQTLK